MAMLAVGAFVLWSLYPGPLSLVGAWQDAAPPIAPRPMAYVTLTLLGALAVFTLPHQFHVGVVECNDRRQLRTARWLFLLFLLLISLPIGRWPRPRTLRCRRWVCRPTCSCLACPCRPAQVD